MPSTDKRLLTLALLGLCILGIWYYKGSSRIWPTPPIATLFTEGEIKRRGARSLEWEDIHGETKIYLRDTVFTPERTRSEVVFPNGTVFRLEPNSMVQFDEVTLNNVDLVLLEGNVVLKSVPSAEKVPEKQEDSIFFNLGKPKPEPTPLSAQWVKPKITVRSQVKANPLRPQAPQVAHRAAERAAKVMETGVTPTYSLDRPVSFMQPLEQVDPLVNVQNHASRRLRGYQSALRLQPLKGIEVDLSDLQLNEMGHYNIVPKIPADGAAVSQQSPCFLIAWSPIPLPGMSYYLEISRDPQFRYVRSYGTETNFIHLLLNDEADAYHWRVRAVRGSDSLVSTLNRFYVPRAIAANGTAKKLTNFFPTWEVCYPK